MRDFYLSPISREVKNRENQTNCNIVAAKKTAETCSKSLGRLEEKVFGEEERKCDKFLLLFDHPQSPRAIINKKKKQ